MFAKPQRLLLLVPLLASALTVAWPIFVSPGTARAQGSDDYFFEDEEGFQEEDPFREQDEFGKPTEDFTEGGEFIDESKLTPAEQAVTAGGRQQQLRVLGERELLPQNAAWGAGTGLLIGGWFALINQGSNRETQRSLGLGVVLGTLVGLAVGARSLIAPQAPRPVSALDNWRIEPGVRPFAASGSSGGLASSNFASSGLLDTPLTLSFTFRF